MWKCRFFCWLPSYSASARMVAGTSRASPTPPWKKRRSPPDYRIRGGQPNPRQGHSLGASKAAQAGDTICIYLAKQSKKHTSYALGLGRIGRRSVRKLLALWPDALAVTAQALQREGTVSLSPHLPIELQERRECLNFGAAAVAAMYSSAPISQWTAEVYRQGDVTSREFKWCPRRCNVELQSWINLREDFTLMSITRRACKESKW